MFGLEDEIINDWRNDIRKIITYVKENCPEHLKGVCEAIGHPPIDFTYYGNTRKECFCNYVKSTIER